MHSPVPPSALEAERAVLSACLLSADALDEVADLLRPEHWYAEAHALVWSGVLDVMRAGQAVDVVTVANALRQDGRFERIGGSGFLAELVDATPSVANVRDHALVVVDKWRARQLIETCHRLAAEGYGVSDVSAYLDEAEQAVFRIADTSNSDAEPVMLGDAATLERSRLAEVASGKRELLGVTSGLRALDRRLGGYQAGSLTVLAARPGMGKTASAVGMALAAAEHGWVAFVSLEMTVAEVTDRCLAQMANVDLADMRNGKLGAEGWRAVDMAGERMRELPMAIVNDPVANVFRLRRTLRRLKARARRAGSDLALAVLDYLQLMQPTTHERGRSREQEVSEMSRGMKAIAQQLGVPVLALSQLNRSVESRADKRPLLADLRESGAIEQDADNVLFLYRPGYYLEQAGKFDDTEGRTEVIVSKQRNGPTGVVNVQWWSGPAAFSDLEAATWECQV